MAFGLNFGINKSKSKSTTDIDKTETTNQTETGSKATTGTVSTTGSTTGTSNTQTQQSQTGATSQQSAGTTSQQQAATQFADPVLSGIEGLVGQLMGTSSARPALAEMGQFDAETFVNQGMQAAEAKTNTALDEALNGMYDATGGRANSNSMVALLENRTRGDAAANLAGVNANLNSQAQEIMRSNMLGNNQVRATDNSFVTTLLDALKGGRSAGSTTGQEAQTSTGTNASNTTGSSATQNQENTSQQQVTNLLEILNNVLSGTVNTTGTETTKSKGLNIGGGAGVSV